MKETLAIERLSTNGEGIARLEGKVVFVPFALPGEKWRVEIIQRKKHYNRAVPLELIHFEPDRPIPHRKPECPYFGKCGGCQLQHIGYEDQIRLKRRWLGETFKRVAGIDIEPNETAASPPWEYRNKITLPLFRGENGIGVAYRHWLDPSRFVPVNDCPIASGKLRRALPALNRALGRSPLSLMAYSKSRQLGARVQLREHEGKVKALFLDLQCPDAEARRLADELTGKEGVLDEMTIPAGRGEYHLFGAGGYSAARGAPPLDAGAFMQVNGAAADFLYRHVAGLPFQSGESALDGYCGTGILTIKLAKRFKRVFGVEIDKSAIELAKKRPAPAGLDIRWERRSAERFLAESDEPFGAMVLNPPRAGLTDRMRELTLERQPADLVFVSCHPAALARDAAPFLERGYRAESLQPIDMFPQTHHLESVLHLRR